MKDFTEEELKTFTGCLMLDLRGSWNWNDSSRIESLQEAFIALKEHLEGDELKESEDMIKFCEEELVDCASGEWDGRVFRGEFLYGYRTDKGCTQRVKDELDYICNYPEYHNVQVIKENL